MRASAWAVWLSMGLLCGCGGEEAGFRIDQVTITPDDLPLNSQSTEEIRISALVYDDRHEVEEVLVRSDEAFLWVDMVPGRYPKWSARIPVGDFTGFPIGTYWIDIEARDDADRTLVLENAVNLRIRED
jgi:hypothetical protein